MFKANRLTGLLLSTMMLSTVTLSTEASAETIVHQALSARGDAVARMQLLSGDPRTGTFQADKSEVRGEGALLSMNGRYVSLLSSHSLSPRERTTSHFRVWSGDLRAKATKRFDPADAGRTLNGDSGPVLDLSDDGRYTLFYTSAGSIVKGYKNAPLIYDRKTQEVSPAVPKSVLDKSWNLFSYEATRLSGDGSKVIFTFQGKNDGSAGIGLLDRASGELLSTITIPNNNDAPSIGSVDIDRAGEIVLVQVARLNENEEYLGRLFTWDGSSDYLTPVPTQAADVYRQAYLSADGKYAAYANFETGGASGNDTIYMQDLAGSKAVALKTRRDSLVSLDGISGDSRWVIGQLGDQPVLWDWAAGRTVMVPQPSSAPPGYKLIDHSVSSVNEDASEVLVQAAYRPTGAYGYQTATFLWSR